MNANSPQAAAQNARVLLLIDDEPNVLYSLRRHFQRLDYNVFVAENGQQALTILEQNLVDVIITDMRMPTMSGADLLQEVSARWTTAVRILLTGYADLKVTTDAIRAGPIDHFTTR